MRVREVPVGQRAARASARAGRQLFELPAQLVQHQPLALPARLVDLVLRDACRHKARTRVPSEYDSNTRSILSIGPNETERNRKTCFQPLRVPVERWGEREREREREREKSVERRGEERRGGERMGWKRRGEKARTSFRHLGLDVVERVLVLADVVGHVSIRIHRQQVGAARDEQQEVEQLLECDESGSHHGTPPATPNILTVPVLRATCSPYYRYFLINNTTY